MLSAVPYVIAAGVAQVIVGVALLMVTLKRTEVVFLKESVTVAVKATGCPYCDGFCEELSVVVVG